MKRNNHRNYARQWVARAPLLAVLLLGLAGLATTNSGNVVLATSPGSGASTGPASAFRPLDDPLFGPNYRANTDPQSPNLAQQGPSISVNPTNPLNVVAAA